MWESKNFLKFKRFILFAIISFIWIWFIVYIIAWGSINIADKEFKWQAKRECTKLLEKQMKFPETTKILSFSSLEIGDSRYRPGLYSNFNFTNLYQWTYSSKNWLWLDGLWHFICGTLKNDSKKSVLIVD